MFHGKFTSIHCRYLCSPCRPHAADAFWRTAVGRGMWWCLAVLGMFDINWWFDISLPCLMDGVLAEESARRCLYFFPSSLYVWGTHFSVFTCQIQTGPARVKERAPSAPAYVRADPWFSQGMLLLAVWVFPVTARRNNDIYPTQQNPMFLNTILRLLWKLREFLRSNSLNQ